jgi:hypothetical protein
VTRKERIEVIVDAALDEYHALEGYYLDDRTMRTVIRRALDTWGRELMMAAGRAYDDDEENGVEFENEETP